MNEITIVNGLGGPLDLPVGTGKHGAATRNTQGCC